MRVGAREGGIQVTVGDVSRAQADAADLTVRPLEPGTDEATEVGQPARTHVLGTGGRHGRGRYRQRVQRPPRDLVSRMTDGSFLAGVFGGWIWATGALVPVGGTCSSWRA